jgi:hypothetical protein
MHSLKEVEQAISNFSNSELEGFRNWYEEFDAKLWDKQFEDDVKNGKLEELTNAALTDFHSNKAKEL